MGVLHWTFSMLHLWIQYEFNQTQRREGASDVNVHCRIPIILIIHLEGVSGVFIVSAVFVLSVVDDLLDERLNFLKTSFILEREKDAIFFLVIGSK